MHKSIVLFVLTLMLGKGIEAHQAHIHGVGQLSIAQDQQNWFVEFHVPAMDLLGFEQAPQSAQQKQAVQKLADKLADIKRVIAFPDACLLKDTEIRFPTTQQGHTHHSDIQMQYRLECKEAVARVSITLFNWARGVAKLETQWLTDSSVSARILTPEAAILVF